MNQISPAELKNKLDAKEKFVLIDVREQQEHDICRIDGARLIPLSEFEGRVGELSSSDSIVVYCHHGQRSAHAGMWLERQGFSQVANLDGGIDAWAEQVDPAMERY
jgi:rhodanese-related sulfurtransferase